MNCSPSEPQSRAIDASSDVYYTWESNEGQRLYLP